MKINNRLKLGQKVWVLFENDYGLFQAEGIGKIHSILTRKDQTLYDTDKDPDFFRDASCYFKSWKEACEETKKLNKKEKV